MTKLFTSDGASGAAMTELSCETAVLIGRAMATVLRNRAGRKVKILIGRDTRLSGEILSLSLAAGCCSAGADVGLLGVIPTPAVSYLAEKYSADAGVMITATHNTYEFNGIKIFNSRGLYVSLEALAEIERLVTSAPNEMIPAGGEDIGRITQEKNAEWDYVRKLIKCVDGGLERMRIAVDCANGAACSTAEKFFRGIGAAEVKLINNEPDGLNINRGCGISDLEPLKKCIIENRCHAGVALDGDGGRCVILDEKGSVIDGDRITALLAYSMKAEQKLASNTCVVSQTANLGFFRWAKDNGIVVATAHGFGGRHITERMIAGDYSLGGSPSGHLVLLDCLKVSDGQLAAAKIFEISARTGRRMSELASIYEPYPQIVLNLPLRPEYSGRWQDVPAVSEMIEFCRRKLEGDGRVFVRESSTSPTLRIIAEGRDRETAWQYAQAIAKTVRDNVGLDEE